MIPAVRYATGNDDPLIVAFFHRKPYDAEIVDQAINYRDSMITRLSHEIEILKRYKSHHGQIKVEI